MWTLAIYDGVVTLADDDIPVIVEFDDDHVRMSASGKEIGQWPADQISITHLADTTYTITAENETLQFVPNQPTLFAAAVNGAGGKESVRSPREPVVGDSPGDGIREAPPPRPLTMGLFYALCATTAAMAIWSLVSMIF